MSTTIPQLPNHAVLEVGPGDEEAATAVEAWLREYTTSRDPVLRQRIILAYLGLADRLASRYRHSRGTTPEDLTQTAPGRADRRHRPLRPSQGAGIRALCRGLCRR